MFKKIITRPIYLMFALILLAMEILIALFVEDNFVRPYVGDYLVVMLLYCLLRAFSPLNILISIISVFCFACLIEWLQYMNIVSVLGLNNVRIARVIIGTSFEWGDIMAYALGCISILIIEKVSTKHGLQT